MEDPATTRLRKYLTIRTDHPNPDYKAAVTFLKAQAHRIGLPVKVHGKPNKPIVIMTWKAKKKLPSIMLTSHMDVVPAAKTKWSHEPFAAVKSEDGKIYGRGSQDMKSQGISYIEAIGRLKNQGFVPLRTIHVVFTPDSELGGMGGLAEFVGTPHFKAMNVGFALDESSSSDGSFFLVFNDERANWALNVTCQGTSGHGSMMLHHTAGEKARIVLEEFSDRRKKEGAKLSGKGQQTELGKVTTINLTKLEGGETENFVPDSFKMTYDIRVSADEDHDAFFSWILSVRQKVGDGCSVHFLRKEHKVAPTSVDDGNPFWSALKAAVEKLGHTVKAVPNPGCSGARFLRTVGVPVLGFSAIKDTPVLAHSRDEYIPEKIFLQGIEVYEEVIAALSSVSWTGANQM